MIDLISVYRERQAAMILHDLHKEQGGQTPIDEYSAFIRSGPYHCWYLIRNADNEYVGEIHMTREREVGVTIATAHAAIDYGAPAITRLLSMWPGKIYSKASSA